MDGPYGCTMESGEAKLLGPWPHCLQNKLDFFRDKQKLNQKKNMQCAKIFAKIKLKVKIAILSFNHRFQKLQKIVKPTIKWNLNQRHYNNSDSRNNFNFLLKVFNDWQDLILSDKAFQSMGPWNDIVFRLSEVLHCGRWRFEFWRVLYLWIAEFQYNIDYQLGRCFWFRMEEMKEVKRMGPRTEPWGTPVLVGLWRRHPDPISHIGPSETGRTRAKVTSAKKIK